MVVTSVCEGWREGRGGEGRKGERDGGNECV